MSKEERSMSAEAEQAGGVRLTRKLQAQARRAQILEAAVRLFAQYGYDGTSTRQIAQAVHITEGLIFHYFPTKADLLAAILETHHVFLGALRSTLSSEYDQPAALLLPQIAREWLLTLRHEEAFTSVLLATAQTNPQVGAMLQQVIQQGIGLIATYLKERVQAGELRADLPLETSAHLFFSSLLVFFLNYRTLDDTAWETRATTFIGELLSIWLTGTRT
jgi:AcrR family transcriptional regulator